MIHHIATYISKKIIINIPAEKENYNIFVYAFEKILSEFFIILFLCILGIITGTFSKMIVYILFVSLLRGQTSGFHAKSQLGCIFLSSGTSMICIFISNFIYHFNMILLFIFLVISIIYISFTSPVNHIALDLTPYEIFCHKKRTYLVLSCETIIVFFTYLFPFAREVSVTGCLAIITVAFFMILSKVTNQEVKHYD